MFEEMLQQGEGENDNALSTSLRGEFDKHLDALKNSFKEYFNLKVET